MHCCPSTDYTVTYTGLFIDADTYDVTISAVSNSNYKGTNSETFTINKYGTKAIEKLSLEFADGNASYQENTSKDTFVLINSSLFSNKLRIAPVVPLI